MAASYEARDSDSLIGSPSKRRRIEHAPLSPNDDSDYEESVQDEESKPNEDVFSQADDAQSYTPATPFSPAPRKFPSEMKTIKCTWEGCTKMFNRPARLVSHLRSHTNERPFVCSEPGCGKSYLEEKHLKQHIKGSHTHERAYQCDWEGCGKAFLTATRLRRHREAHEGHNRFRCTAYPPCDQTFRKHQTLQRHIRSEHLQLAPFPCTYVDPVTSEPCGAGFDGSTGLRKHEVQVHGTPQFWCDQCARETDSNGAPVKTGFATKAQLDTHIRKSHFNCLFCDFRCTSRKDLSKHTDIAHPPTSATTEARPKKSVKCTYEGCNKTFYKNANLNVHIRTAHEGERYICGTFDVTEVDDLSHWDMKDGCGKDFTTRANLADHVRTAHLGLPSVANMSRKRKAKNGANGISDQDGPKLNKNKRPVTSVVDELLGDAYLGDERRTLRCAIPDCPNMFIRVYDLNVHLRTKHQLATPDMETPAALPDVPEMFKNQNSALEELQGQQSFDLDWDLQNPGQFWIGADDGTLLQRPEDQWLQDEVEMRGLIDPELQEMENLDRYPDPELLKL